MAMIGHSLTLLLLLLFQAGSRVVMGVADEDFFKDCPPSNCSDGGPEIRFPLRLESSPARCGLESTSLISCSGNQTILTLPSSGSYNVTAINYLGGMITISSSSWGSCPLRDLTSVNLTSSIYDQDYYDCTFTVLNCSTNSTLDVSNGAIVGPVSCLAVAGEHGFLYAAEGSLTMDQLPGCRAITRGWSTLASDRDGWPYCPVFRDALEDFTRNREFTRDWPSSLFKGGCWECESEGGRCALNWTSNETFCIPKAGRHHGAHVGLIIGISVGVFIILTSVVFLFLYVYGKSDKEKATRLKVEQFLASYKATKPTRYSYADIKRFTKRFKQKIGQGGFGSVYKGELPNEIPVAVKMLENSRSDGEEFINEVATIGRIHHFNIVRLLGFCSEGTRRALVYEFLPHESLEKFIFQEEGKRTWRAFSMEKLLDIAIGIAQGIEYLHQGCNQRILHFDIKPHNILLDHNFNPKISDFGLAKLCSRDHSIVTMTTARGTMGYIAPEIYSRNFGTVSYKSDVYSFGMLLLEMVSGKKNIDPANANQSEVYYPEWIYGKLVQGQNLGAAMETECNEENVKKLVIVALWCIQWSPTDRPSMTRVVQMLMGSLQSLEIPPKPFISTDHDEDTSPTEE